MDSRQIESLRPFVERPTPGHQPLDVVQEQEAFGSGGDFSLASVLTVFLRGSECSFRCLMCDLWKYTHQENTAEGAIPAQIEQALRDAPKCQNDRWIKLYNASNFFAARNVPTEDLPKIARQLSSFSRVVVENHPKILTPSIVNFRDQLAGQLEVAMGLETIHPKVLLDLNKQMTAADFRHACQWLSAREIDSRAFVLLRPPGLGESEGSEWCLKTIEFAWECGVRHVSIVPVRGGNGALELLKSQGQFESPLARSLEFVLQESLSRKLNLDSIVTVDLWDWEQLRGTCEVCSVRRKESLSEANRTQRYQIPEVHCCNIPSSDAC